MRFVIIMGNPLAGFSCVGTFPSADDANWWADMNITREYDWWVMPIEAPKGN